MFRNDEDFTIRRVKEILQTADDPAKISRLMIAELEGALVEVRGLTSGRLADRHDWRRRLAEAKFREENWGQKAEEVLSWGREDLARAALVEKHNALAEASALASEVALLDELIRASDEEVAKIQYLLRDLKARQTSSQKRLAYH
ncbi:PspA/IM30 family protein [Sphingosinicella rhizophila]|uniref:PspA/IM30 family protein n=1 Tax=Sphingosinicella rhizophila TaxID=3050082 RepID=A0ABU3QBR8_9SPHN|nr:PspA/IM30 family protein [Sphingosinicella sp. GR2756]MDT9600851.1 PspA/IM30 family protein [Sphingosinicella sp. GR2756]